MQIWKKGNQEKRKSRKIKIRKNGNKELENWILGKMIFAENGYQRKFKMENKKKKMENWGKEKSDKWEITKKGYRENGYWEN